MSYYAIDPTLYFRHHGIKDQKWGVRRFQDENGHRTELGRLRDINRKRKSTPDKEKVFISGTSKMQSKDSEYYREELPEEVINMLNDIIKRNAKVLIGDCVGADSLVQEYLADLRYKNVDIYVSGDQVRNNADTNGKLGWKVHNIDSSMYEKDTKEWHATKDIEMNKEATSGMAIILDEGAKATRKNIDRFIDDDKPISIYELNKASSEGDKWLNIEDYKKERI